MANIEQAIKFVGMDDSIEIWANTNNNQTFMAPDAFSQALEEAMKESALPLQTIKE